FYPVHFPIYDMEQSLGITIKNIRPGDEAEVLLYWDDSALYPWGGTPANSPQSIPVNVTGTESPDHIWWATGDNGIGNWSTLNTWGGSHVEVIEEVFEFWWDNSDIGITKTVNI